MNGGKKFACLFGKMIGKKRLERFFWRKHPIKSGRVDFFGGKVLSDVDYSIFHHSRSFPTRLEVSFTPEKYQPPGGV